jgi:hypothetical protein
MDKLLLQLAIAATFGGLSTQNHTSYRPGSARADAEARKMLTQGQQEFSMTRWLLFPVLSLCIIIGTSAATPAPIDFAKFTCEQFFKREVPGSRIFTIWLGGFYNGTRHNTTLDVNVLRKKRHELFNYCISHPKAILMDAATTIFGKEK